MTTLDQNLSTRELIELVRDIFECIEVVDSSDPVFTIFNDEIGILEIEGKRFRIHVQDTAKFN